MKLLWTSQAWEDYLHWQEADPKIFKSVNELIKDTMRNPFRAFSSEVDPAHVKKMRPPTNESRFHANENGSRGLGKPEPLKHALKGWWSRRITQDHRLVYRVSGKDDAQLLEIAACRYHYE